VQPQPGDAELPYHPPDAAVLIGMCGSDPIAG
jgi:hypothetical protein